MIFTDDTFDMIYDKLQTTLESEEEVSFVVLDPDCHHGLYAGTPVQVGKYTYLYRSLRAWMELAEILGCRMCTPKTVDEKHIRLTYRKLRTTESFHTAAQHHLEEKYGATSPFFALRKMEEPAFYHYYKQALALAKLPMRKRILDLGINRGDEFEVIRNSIDINKYKTMELVGIDHSASVIEYAQGRFEEENVRLLTADINHLSSLGLGRFDLLISIGTLQSPGIAFKPLLMELVQQYLRDDSAVILGFPNSRWIDGEMCYGAKAAHYSFSEMGVVLEDILFAKRYLQQKKYRVMVTGKQYLFLTAVKIG